jgi:hypothetical protein
VGQLGERGVSSDGKDREWYVDIRGYKVVPPPMSTSSIIVVVGQYSTIPLEMSIGIVYGPPTDSPMCGIT